MDKENAELVITWASEVRKTDKMLDWWQLSKIDIGNADLVTSGIWHVRKMMKEYWRLIQEDGEGQCFYLIFFSSQSDAKMVMVVAMK